MATRDFTLQVRHTCDDNKQFEAAKAVMQQVAREVYAKLRILGGQGAPEPKIFLFSDDFLEGVTDEKTTAGAAAGEQTGEPDAKDL